jgi:tRNA pseudouridine55 synthase
LIVYLELTEYAFPFVEIKLRCSHGFYVRGLADDLGRALGCGGHVSALRRLGVADLTVDDSMTMEALSSLADQTERRKSLVPADQGLCHIPEVRLSVDAAYYLCRGQAVRAAGLPKHGEVRIYSTDAGFLGVGQVTDDGRLAPRRLMVG